MMVAERDEVMEVACCIPMAPVMVPMSDIAEDVGIKTQHVKKCCTEITKRLGIALLRRRRLDGGSGEEVGCMRDSWSKLARMGTMYWNMTYEGRDILIG